jgi:hypothetical protein
MKNKQRIVSLSNKAWKIAKKMAFRSKPRTSRPMWIEQAIIEQAKTK